MELVGCSLVVYHGDDQSYLGRLLKVLGRRLRQGLVGQKAYLFLPHDR